MSSHETPRRFAVRTKVISGLGSLSVLQAEVELLGISRLAVVADQSVADVGVLRGVLKHASGFAIGLTTLTPPNPGTRLVEQAVESARAAGCDGVLAVGGGSALGAGKALAIRLTNPLDILEYEGIGHVTANPAAVIAVPTTAGSGSEVSNALVLHDSERFRDVIVRGEGCEPRVAILDATVLRGLPERPLVHAALDALSHALEALWSKGASRFTNSLALDAAQTIIDSLPTTVDGARTGLNRSGGNDDALQRLLEASSQANMACGNSGLALVHALSSSSTVHLAHGHQNGILLPYVAEFNQGVLPVEARALIPKISALYEHIGFDARFESGAAEAASMVAASTGHMFRFNNARPSSDPELRDLLVAAGAAASE